MIIGIQDIYYNVQNMEKSVEFYTNILEMKLINKNDYWTLLNIDNVNIGLHWTEGSPVPEIPRDSHGANAGAVLTLKVKNISEEEEKLIKNNVKILGKLDEQWGKLIVFEDPDGNVLKFMEPSY